MLQIHPRVQSSATSFVGVLKYDPQQPRAPKGSPQGGEFTATGVTRHTSTAAMQQEPLPKTLAEAEDRIRDEANEHVFLLKNGKPFMVLGNNSASHVGMDGATDADLKDAVLTHNHPSNFGLSGQDGVTAAKRNMLEMRAVVNARTDIKKPAGVHVIRRTGTEWPKNFADGIAVMDAELRVELGSQIHHGDISVAEANATHHILMYERLQRELGGFVYTFEPKR